MTNEVEIYRFAHQLNKLEYKDRLKKSILVHI
jgi:hypothetical protein